jgi:hypothetical protein
MSSGDVRKHELRRTTKKKKQFLTKSVRIARLSGTSFVLI